MSNSEHPRASLALFEPHPNVLYSLDITAHLTGASRRSILIYCRLGLIRPLLQEPYGMMVFSEETIHAVRRIENLRGEEGMNLNLIKKIFTLVDEVERLRSEVRFLRGR